MVEDSLDGPGHLVIGTVVDGHENEMSGSPPIYPLAGLGEIAKHERLEDGRFHILIVGLYRVRIQEVESDRLYRRVRAERVHESTGERDRARSLHEDLQRAVLDSIPEKLHEAFKMRGLHANFVCTMESDLLEMNGKRMMNPW